jgi:hypothetical protein
MVEAVGINVRLFIYFILTELCTPTVSDNLICFFVDKQA